MKVLAMVIASTFVGHRKYLQSALKVLAMTNESTCDDHRKYFHF